MRLRIKRSLSDRPISVYRDQILSEEVNDFEFRVYCLISIECEQSGSETCDLTTDQLAKKLGELPEWVELAVKFLESLGWIAPKKGS